MKAIAIDTNIYVAFKQGREEILTVLRRCDSISIDVTVIAELLSGFKHGGRENKNRKEFELFLDTPRVQVLEHDFSTAEFYASLYTILRKKGTPLPVNDIWIAASAMRFGLGLFTLDKHFELIDGLMLIR